MAQEQSSLFVKRGTVCLDTLQLYCLCNIDKQSKKGKERNDESKGRRSEEGEMRQKMR